MSPSTAIIPHPDFPLHIPLDKSPCLENSGPSAPHHHKVNLYWGKNLPCDYYRTEVRPDLNDVDVEERDCWEIECAIIRRCLGILENAEAVEHHGDHTETRYLLSKKHLEELMWRLTILNPHYEFGL